MMSVTHNAPLLLSIGNYDVANKSQDFGLYLYDNVHNGVCVTEGAFYPDQ